MRFILTLCLICTFVSTPTQAEEVGAKNSIVRDRIHEKPFQYSEVPENYREELPGYVEAPLIYRRTPLQYRDLPYGFREKLRGLRDVPQGYSSTPPNFILRKEHYLVNDDEDLFQERTSDEDTAIRENFKEIPPGYKPVE